MSYNASIDFNRQAGRDVLPLPRFGNGDYRLSNWDWKKLEWPKIERHVFNLQKRIYKVTKAGNRRLAKKLGKLLSRSQATVILAVRRVTSDNKGKRSKGVDGKKYDTPEQRKQLVEKVTAEARKGWKDYQAKPAKRKYIPKANGKLRPLGIPTQEDRVIQQIVKTALEPQYEAQFESCSYGFRPAMSTQDAIDTIVRSTIQKQKWVLDADIKGFFDNISHEYLIKHLSEKMAAADK